MKIFMYILAFTLSALGYLSFPYLVQKVIMGCTVDFVNKKTTYITKEDIVYFYNLDSGLGLWSNTDVKEGDPICSISPAR